MFDQQPVFVAEEDLCPASPCPTPPLAWFVAYSRPRLEAVAVSNLQQQRFEVYLPRYKRLKKVRDRVRVVFEPMFPRYVFFHPAHAEQSIAPVRSTRGVSNLVRFGERIATIDGNVLDTIRAFEAARNAADETELSGLRPGSRVRFCDPAFRDLEGLVHSVAARRVAVLLELMGRPQIVHVEAHRLAVV